MIEMKGNLCILLPCFRIFEGSCCGIKIFPKHIHRKLRNIYFIKTQKSEVVSGCIPVKGSYKTKFFLIYPICNTVDDLVLLPIIGNLCFISGSKIFYVNILVKNISYFISVGRESGLLDLIIAY